MSGPRLDLDSYLSWMRREDGVIRHLGCDLTPAGARIAAARLVELADEEEGGDVPEGTKSRPTS